MDAGGSGSRRRLHEKDACAAHCPQSLHRGVSMNSNISRLAGLILASVFMIPGGALAAQAADSRAKPAPAAGSPVSATSRIVLLGTGGGPIARIGRSQPATLLQVGTKAYLIDVGEGTPRQMVRAGVKPSAVDAVFFTHLHLDHTAGLMGFLALDWTDRRQKPVEIYGPPGTQSLVHDTLQALKTGEVIFRLQIPGLPEMASVFSGHDWEVTTAREVYRDGTITVRAVENSHYSTMQMPRTDHGIDRAYSYRFDMPGRSVVITGDTGPSRAVEELARGADVLVSELIDLDSVIASLQARKAATGVDQQPLIDHMEKEHLTPENIGRLAAAAGVKRVVLTHFGTAPGVEAIDRDAIIAGIRKHYQGPVDLGEDLAAY